MKNTITNLVTAVGFAVAFVGFCGAIISTLSAFIAMAGAGTAGITIAQFFVEG